MLCNIRVTLRRVMCVMGLQDVVTFQRKPVGESRAAFVE